MVVSLEVLMSGNRAAFVCLMQFNRFFTVSLLSICLLPSDIQLSEFVKIKSGILVCTSCCEQAKAARLSYSLQSKQTSLYLEVIEEKMGVCQLKDQLLHLQAQVQHSRRVLNKIKQTHNKHVTQFNRSNFCIVSSKDSSLEKPTLPNF